MPSGGQKGNYKLMVQSLLLLSLAPHGPEHARLPITNSWSMLKLMSIRSVMPSNHLILCHPILLLSSIFPASGSFPMSYFFASGGQSIGFSFSLSPSNEYSWLISFRIDWVDLLCSPRDSQESSPRPQFKSIDCLVLSSLYSPTLTSIHDYWKNSRFD